VALRAALAGAGLDLRLEVGAEVALAPDVLEAADEGALPCLAGTRHVLVEAYPTGDLDLARRLIFELQLRGYRVVLAHPERLSALIDRPERARELSAGGVLLQVTRAGLTGRLSWRMGRLARWLIQEGLADLLATDAHGPGDQVRLTSVRKLCGRLAGPAAFECLTVTNPARLLEAAP
jgi:protein-tyrosine phosphatase